MDPRILHRSSHYSIFDKRLVDKRPAVGRDNNVPDVFQVNVRVVFRACAREKKSWLMGRSSTRAELGPHVTTRIPCSDGATTSPLRHVFMFLGTRHFMCHSLSRCLPFAFSCPYTEILLPMRVTVTRLFQTPTGGSPHQGKILEGTLKKNKKIVSRQNDSMTSIAGVGFIFFIPYLRPIDLNVLCNQSHIK